MTPSLRSWLRHNTFPKCHHKEVHPRLSCHLGNYNIAVMTKHMVSILLHKGNTLRPRQNGRHFADDTFKRIFLNENVWISIEIPLKFVPKGPINNIPALVKIMAWRRPGDKALSGPMMVRLPTHICVSRPQWVNWKWADVSSLKFWQIATKLQVTKNHPIYCSHWVRWSDFVTRSSLPTIHGNSDVTATFGY